MTSRDLLTEMATLWGRGRIAYRDCCVSVGTLLHEYILARLREADGLNERDRRDDGLTRETCIAEAGRRLDLSNGKLAELLRVSMCVALLSGGGSGGSPSGVPHGSPPSGGGNVGSLSYSSLRALSVFVERRQGKVVRSRRDPADGELTPEQSEEWRVKPVEGTEPAVLFQRAVEEAWGSERVREEISRTAVFRRGGPGPTKRPPEPHRPAPQGGRPQRQTAAPETDWRRLARNGTPRDIADMIVCLITNSSDPKLVASLIEEQLAALI